MQANHRDETLQALTICVFRGTLHQSISKPLYSFKVWHVGEKSHCFVFVKRSGQPNVMDILKELETFLGKFSDCVYLLMSLDDQ